MRLWILKVTVVLVCVGAVERGYGYVIESGYHPGFSLHDSETLLMTGGGAGSLVLWNNSFARIEGTSPLQQGFGGIWNLDMLGHSNLEFYGGEVYELAIGSYARAVLAGGRIDHIWSSQSAWTHAGDPPVLVPNPHIEIIYSGDLPTVDENNLLTGAWGDGGVFSIQLIDVQGYSPAIENIFFTPEPATLLLLLGGVSLMRKRR